MPIFPLIDDDLVSISLKGKSKNVFDILDFRIELLPLKPTFVKTFLIFLLYET